MHNNNINAIALNNMTLRGIGNDLKAMASTAGYRELLIRARLNPEYKPPSDSEIAEIAERREECDDYLRQYRQGRKS